MDIKKRSNRTNKKHQAFMVDFLESHPEMIHTSFTQPMARQQYNKLWQELANSLNAMGMGEKTVSQWQRVLSDWISKSKVKTQMTNLHMKQTGGGPNLKTELSDLEVRLMNLKGWSCVVGDNKTAEAGFGSLSAHNADDDMIMDINPAVDDTSSFDILEYETPCFWTSTLSSTSTSTSLPIVIMIPTSTKLNQNLSTKLIDVPQSSNNKNDLKQLPRSTTQSDASKSKKIDMCTMHLETIGVLKEMNTNLASINNTLQTQAAIMKDYFEFFTKM